MKSFLTQAQPTHLPKSGTSPFLGLIADEEFVRIFPAWKKVLRRPLEEALFRARTRTPARIFTPTGEGSATQPRAERIISAVKGRDAQPTRTEIQRVKLVKTSSAFEKSVVAAPWLHRTQGRSI